MNLRIPSIWPSIAETYAAADYQIGQDYQETCQQYVFHDAVEGIDANVALTSGVHDLPSLLCLKRDLREGR